MPAKTHGGDPNHPLFPHGTYSGYKHACRCTPCREAKRDYGREHARSRRRDPAQKERMQASLRRYRQTPKWLTCPSNQPENRGAYRKIYRQLDHVKAKRRAEASMRYALEKSVMTGNSVTIAAIYAACPDGFEVDHIIPLTRGGEHHEDNLQYLRSEVNRLKSNKLDFDYSPYPGCRIPWQSVLNV